MRAERFVAARRGDWQRLEELVDKAQRSRLTSLGDAELHELGALYRRAATDLARAQTRYANTMAGQELVRSLNDLVLRAHMMVYSAPPRGPGGFDFILYGFPAAIRRQWRVILIAAVLMYGPALLAYVTVLVDPAMTSMFVPDSAVQQVRERANKKIVQGWGANNNYDGLLSSPQTASMIMTNNIHVTMYAVALGVTMGLGTAFVLIQNGLLIGGLSAVATMSHVDLLFWAVILPHGIIELTSICIAGGAGFLLAKALYAPGDLPRRDALKLAGIEAARLMVGVAFLLVIAGTIEGFITPQPFNPLLKITFSLLTAMWLLLYFNKRKHGDDLSDWDWSLFTSGKLPKLTAFEN